MSPEALSRLQRVWRVATDYARRGECVNYRALADEAELPIWRGPVMTKLLDALPDICVKRGCPNLASLVVRKGTGLPSPEVLRCMAQTAGRSVRAEQQACWGRDWDRVEPPAEGDFE